MSLNILGGLSCVLTLVSLGAIAFILLQLRKRPRVCTPYFFLAAVAASVVVDITGAVYWEDAARSFLLVLFLLSAASFGEIWIRDVHPSHVWTARSARPSLRSPIGS